MGSGYTTRPAGTGANVVRFRLVVPDDGNYPVQHATGTTLVRIDQRVTRTADVRGGQWVSPGTFRLAGGLAAGTTVSQSDDANGYVAADAIRLIRQ